MTKTPPPPPEDATPDPLVEGLLDEAMQPLLHLLPAQALPRFREMLAELLLTHPVAGDLLERLRPAPVVSSSAEVPRGDEAELPANEQAKAGRGGAR